MEIPTNATPLTNAARISARRKPKVRLGPPGRGASQAANSASASERLSESMCAASASRERLPLMSPPTSSTTVKAMVSARVSRSARVPPARSRPGPGAAGSWSRACACTEPTVGNRAALGAGRELGADRLLEHEPHVLVDGPELGDLLRASPAEERDELGDELLRGARPRGDPDRLDAVEPLLADLRGVVDQVRVGAVLARHLDEAVRVGGVGRSDHEHEIRLTRELLDRDLPVRRRVTDVVDLGADDVREALAKARDDPGRLVDGERRLGDEGDVVGVLDLELVDVVDRLDERDRVGGLAGRPLDLLMAGVADEHDRVTLLGELARRHMHLRHQWAGGVDRAQVPRRCVLVHGRGDSVGAEHDELALRDLALLLDEDRAALCELLDHMLVVDDLLPHVNGRPVKLERLLDRLHGAIDARAVAARRREQ